MVVLELQGQWWGSGQSLIFCHSATVADYHYVLQLKDDTGRVVSMTRGMKLDLLHKKHFPEGMGVGWLMKQGTYSFYSVHQCSKNVPHA